MLISLVGARGVLLLSLSPKQALCPWLGRMFAYWSHSPTLALAPIPVPQPVREFSLSLSLSVITSVSSQPCSKNDGLYCLFPGSLMLWSWGEIGEKGLSGTLCFSPAAALLMPQACTLKDACSELSEVQQEELVSGWKLSLYLLSPEAPHSSSHTQHPPICEQF